MRPEISRKAMAWLLVSALVLLIIGCAIIVFGHQK